MEPRKTTTEHVLTNFAPLILAGLSMFCSLMAVLTGTSTLLPTGFFCAMLAALSFAAGTWMYERRTFVGPSGRRYPRFKIVDYLSDEMLERVHQVKWVSADILPMRGRPYGEPKMFDAWVCPLGAAINKGYRIPRAGTVADQVAGEKAATAVHWMKVLTAAEEFIKWADDGRIHRDDVHAIFSRRPT